MKLYIFVTSNRPDQYLNSIVHCIEKGARSVVFIQVKDIQLDQVQLNLLRTDVYTLLQNLSEGSYKYLEGSRKDAVVNLAAEYNPEELAKLKARYKLHLSDNIDWKVERLQYSDLRQYISKLATKDSIIDVTSVSKAYIGDIFACSLLENIVNYVLLSYLLSLTSIDLGKL
ncbi:hypothetical protein [Leptolyngbya sp. FACHB-17]|uniref:hypothetical protein n=1 Tax=unclassified Leptolyngbya TaxID=2650499 RepID=UPI00168095A6|nr:hypothetical protein [Leptolyngbya sp. FACHB-17]MBD2082104.1 hypothetical protein [Leptolyngbya sp. FACHB-17]